MDALFCYHIVLMLVATIAFVFMWIGFASPGWLVVTFQEAEAEAEWTVSSLNRSLWYDLHCPQELKDCKTCNAGDDSVDCVNEMGFPKYKNHFQWIETLSEDKEEWVAWGVIMIVVVLVVTAGFILVLTLVCCIFKTYTYRMVAWIAFALWLIGGILVWVPVGMVADMHLDIEDAVNKNGISIVDGVDHDATLHIPYSLVIAAVGGFLALITALMLLWLTGCCSKDDDKSSSRSDTEEVFSERPKSTVVREQRYYGPHPYYPPERTVYHRDEEPAYYVRNGDASEVVVDEFPHYQKHLGSSQWGPNPWYDNRVPSY